jgi:hypothetical protein
MLSRGPQPLASDRASSRVDLPAQYLFFTKYPFSQGTLAGKGSLQDTAEFDLWIPLSV